MSYTAPTADDLTARFPEFGPVRPETLAAILAEAIAAVDDSWIEKDRRTAQMYLAAHLLASEGEPYRSQELASGGDGVAGSLRPVKSMTVGDVSITYGGFDNLGNVKDGVGASTVDWLKTSTYGNRYLSLMKLNFPSATVV